MGKRERFPVAGIGRGPRTCLRTPVQFDDMPDPTDPPTARLIGSPPPSQAEPPASKNAQIPWIDIHQHTQSLTWNDRNKFDLSGGQAAVMIAASYYWAPYRPVSTDDVRFLWDDALRRAATFTQSHFYEQYVAIGIHTWSRVDDYDSLIERLPEYAALDPVVAIGETGIETTQHTSAWPLADQKAVVAEQMRVAKETGLPIILHTPGSSKGQMPAWYADRYEESDASFTDPVLDPETAKLDAANICLELKNDIGLPDDQLVFDHANPAIAPVVLDSTDCYLAFSVSASWLRGLDPADIAGVIDEYGADRVILDTDLAGAMQNDPFAMKRMIFDLLRQGLDPRTVRQIVYDNPLDLLDIDEPA